MSRFFLGIAEQNYVRLCKEAGVVVLGIKGPAGVKKLTVGDGVVYYSPKAEPDGETLQCFTAIGKVTGEDIYERDFGSGTRLWVRAVDWSEPARDVPIRPHLDALSWVKKPSNWGFYMRGSSREITGEDYALIAGAMLGGSA